MSHQLEESTNEALEYQLKKDKPKIILNELFFDKFGHYTQSIIRKRLALMDFNISCYAGTTCNMYQSEFEGILHPSKTILQSQELLADIYKDYKRDVEKYKKELEKKKK